MTTATQRITNRDEYIETLLSWGRHEVLKLCRRIGVKAGSMKNTREIAELLWNISEMNQRHIEVRTTRSA